MKKLFGILLVLLTLVSCSPKTISSSSKYMTMVMIGKYTIIESGTTLVGKSDTIRITVASLHGHLHPKLYVYGAASLVSTNKKETYVSRMMPNNQYQFRYSFNRPGEAVVLVVWEGHRQFTQPFILKLRYYGD